MARDLSHFQDRETAIELFDAFWESESPWILAFNGVSGQGKSTLLEWLEVKRCVAGSMRYASVPIGDFSSSFHAFLARIAESLSARFSERDEKAFKEIYDKALDDLNHRVLELRQSQSISDSPDSQQAMTANIAEAVRGMERQANGIITEEWLKLLRTVGKGERFVLLLDNYDVYQDLVSVVEIRDLWNTFERARQFIPGFRVVLASREAVRHLEHIESLRRGLKGEGLQDLSLHDTRLLLNSLGVTDDAYCQAVYRLASGHPLITKMAAEAWLETPGGFSAQDVPAISGREKVVEWLQVYILNRMDETLRPAAQWTMLLRWFSFEILNSVLETPLSDEQYRKLTSYSFIVPSKLVDGHKAGHDLVRKVQIAYFRREQKTKFHEFHKKAFDYFSGVEGAGLEMLYHQFFINPKEAFEIWGKLESQAAFNFDHYVWGLLHELGLRDELDLENPFRAEILFRAGRRHYYRAEWFLANDYYAEALKLFKEIGDKLGEANVLQAIGDVQQFRKEVDAALVSYNEALKLFKEIGDKLGEANVLQAIGDVQQFRKEVDAALVSYNEALKLFKEIGDKLGEANVLQAIGDVQQFRDDRDAALVSYNEALKLFKEIGDKLGEANVYYSRGRMLVISGKPKEGLEELQSAMNVYEEIGAISSQANIYMFLGQVLASSGQKDEAIKMVGQAVALGEKIDPNHPVTMYMKDFLQKLQEPE